MKLFKRKAQVKPEQKISVQITSDGLSVKNASEDLVIGLVEFWAVNFGSESEPQKNPMGFSNDHVTEVDSDTELAPQMVEAYDDEEDDD